MDVLTKMLMFVKLKKRHTYFGYIRLKTSAKDIKSFNLKILQK